MYKQAVLTLLSILMYYQVSGQNQAQEIHNIATFIKVWGFLKYYHPTLAAGKLDWDSLFVSYVPLIRHEQKESYNRLLEELMQKLGRVEKCVSCQPLGDMPDEWKRNLNFSWLYQDTLLSPAIKSKLQYLRENRHQGESYYVGYAEERKTGPAPVAFRNEKEYADSLLLAQDTYRLLSLARHWNAVEYFFAYKYLLSRNWNQILEQYIPQLMRKMDLEHYHLTLTKLTREVEDGHAVMGNSRYLLENKWSKLVPFSVTYLDRQTIVSEIRYPELNQVNDIQVGDIILQVDKVDQQEIRKRVYPFFKGSNQVVTQGAINNILFAGTTDKVQVQLKRGGKVKTVEVTRYPFKAFWNYKFPSKKVLTLTESCAMVDLGHLKREQVDSVMQVATEQKAIIFDLRNYPQVMLGDFMHYLTDEYKAGYREYDPTLDFVGVFQPYQIAQGKVDSGKVYKGLKVVLVNEYTQSMAEWYAMYFESLPNTVLIGSQTAGTDGSITSIPLPGKINAIFTNVIIEYPDGTQSQKNGIKVDYTVLPTAADIKVGRDSILQFAMNYCRQEVKKQEKENSKPISK